MNGFAWNHNTYYHRLLLRQLPHPSRYALDVGCGAGVFATKLAARVDNVEALDRSPAMVEAAKRTSPANVTCVLGDVLRDPLPSGNYDAILSISALHHLPLEEALLRLATALRPGGVLAAVSLPRRDLPRELPVELVAMVGQRLFAAFFAGARLAGRGSWYSREPTHEQMPIAEPPLTTHQVRQQAADVLPGVQVRRLVFWRYFLLWHKPNAS